MCMRAQRDKWVEEVGTNGEPQGPLLGHVRDKSYNQKQTLKTVIKGPCLVTSVTRATAKNKRRKSTEERRRL